MTPFSKLRLINNQALVLLVICAILNTKNTFSQTIHPDDAQLIFGEYELSKLNRGVNSKYDDTAPILSADEKTLYFFISNHPENTFGKENTQDIWYSEKNEDGSWSEAQHMKAPFNKNKFNQIMTVLPDNNTVLIRGGLKKDSKTFSLVHRVNNDWQKPIPLQIEHYGSMNKGVFSGACLSSDGKNLLLYFSETKGKVVSDIYVSKKISGTKFSKPIKLAEGVNSYKDDFGPYLSQDNQFLFFASDRPGGKGSADLYVSKRLDDSYLRWSKPQNLGEPINTKNFDAYISFNKDKSLGFTTRALKTKDGGHMDIWGIIPKIIQPIKLEFIGNTFAEATKDHAEKPIQAEITILGEITKKSKSIYADSLEGYFETLVDTVGQYFIEVRAEGFFPKRDTISFESMDIDAIIEERYFLKKLEKGITVKLENIFFDFDKTTLRPQSMVELENLLGIMEDTPSLVIQIQGHTDSKGNDDYNQELSQGRAEAVMNYLLAHDIDSTRVSAIGFGEKEPIADNRTEEGRQLNRRVIFTVQ